MFDRDGQVSDDRKDLDQWKEHFKTPKKYNNLAEALVDADLRRLNWMLSQSIISNKNELYLKAMNAIANKYANNPVAAEALYHVGKWHFTEGNKYQPSPEQTYRWEYKIALKIFST